MSLLFPLYALGALALAAPILFHLFQRKPHGQQEFSSLMFLQATPPRLTSRSRLSDLLLLLLRGLALLLLAAAFARPFLRSSTLLDLDAPSRSVALLVDTSASMRRDGVWQEMQRSIDKVVKDLRPTDQVTLIRFDREPNTIISFEAWEETIPSRRLPFLKEQVGGLAPTWHATDLSAAAIEAGDALLQQRLVEDHIQPLQAVVFTDLQEGCDLSGLQSYQWPKDVALDVRTISAPKKTNASIQALPPESSEMDSTHVRVLVRNEGDSDRGQFKLQWEAENSKPVDVYVTPGQTRVVRVTQPRGAKQLNLTGDDNDFDNQLFFNATVRHQKQLWYIGDDNTDDASQSLFYYLQQSALDTRTRQVAIEKVEDTTLLATALPIQCPLIVVTKPLKDSSAEDVKRYASQGGRLLIVLRSGSTANEMGAFLQALFDLPDLQITESASNEYAMLANIDFQNPIFQPFADPRYNDFTKISFWSHRLLSTSAEEPWTLVARFDDQSPAIIEKQVGEGIVWVLTSGWQPDESQLARSTKFVPLLHGFFGSTSEAVARTANFIVGDAVPVTPTEDPTTIVGPSGETFMLDAMTDSFKEVDEPGIYQVQQGENQFALAVNLSADESRTQPLLPDRLEQLGLQLGKQKSVELLETEQRQMRSKELEGKQKLWRWGILAALVAVAMETWIGGRSAKPIITNS